jgi:hypothetical protein
LLKFSCESIRSWALLWRETILLLQTNTASISLLAVELLRCNNFLVQFCLVICIEEFSISSRFSSLLECKFSKHSFMIFWILLVFVVMSPFSSLALLIWVFSLLYFVMLAKQLLILLMFSMSQLFVSLILHIVFCCCSLSHWSQS